MVGGSCPDRTLARPELHTTGGILARGRPYPPTITLRQSRWLLSCFPWQATNGLATVLGDFPRASFPVRRFRSSSAPRPGNCSHILPRWRGSLFDGHGAPAMFDQAHERSPASADAVGRGFQRGPRGGLSNWNVIVSVREGGYNRAHKLLRQFGAVGPSGFLNVLVMRVDAPKHLLEALMERKSREPDTLAFLGHVRPVGSIFTFQSPEEFESRARDSALAFLPELAGKGFHVRMHRHGFKGRLSSQE